MSPQHAQPLPLSPRIEQRESNGNRIENLRLDSTNRASAAFVDPHDKLADPLG